MPRVRAFFVGVVKRMRTTKRRDTGAARRVQGNNADYHLTVEQARRIVSGAATARDRVLLTLLAETGMRRAEIAALHLDDIRWQERRLVVRRGKGSKTRLVPVQLELLDRIRSLMNGSRTGPLFRGREGCDLSLRQINRIVADAGKRAGIQNPNPRYANITCHLFRHSFARWWKSRGGDIEVLAQILGHDSPHTTWQIYGSPNIDEVRESYLQMMKRIQRSKAQ